MNGLFKLNSVSIFYDKPFDLLLKVQSWKYAEAKPSDNAYFPWNSVVCTQINTGCAFKELKVKKRNQQCINWQITNVSTADFNCVFYISLLLENTEFSRSPLEFFLYSVRIFYGKPFFCGKFTAWCLPTFNHIITGV